MAPPSIAVCGYLTDVESNYDYFERYLKISKVLFYADTLRCCDWTYICIQYIRYAHSQRTRRYTRPCTLMQTWTTRSRCCLCTPHTLAHTSQGLLHIRSTWVENSVVHRRVSITVCVCVSPTCSLPIPLLSPPPPSLYLSLS